MKTQYWGRIVEKPDNMYWILSELTKPAFEPDADQVRFRSLAVAHACGCFRSGPLVLGLCSEAPVSGDRSRP